MLIYMSWFHEFSTKYKQINIFTSRAQILLPRLVACCDQQVNDNMPLFHAAKSEPLDQSVNFFFASFMLGSLTRSQRKLSTLSNFLTHFCKKSFNTNTTWLPPEMLQLYLVPEFFILTIATFNFPHSIKYDQLLSSFEYGQHIVILYIVNGFHLIQVCKSPEPLVKFTLLDRLLQ